MPSCSADVPRCPASRHAITTRTGGPDGKSRKNVGAAGGQAQSVGEEGPRKKGRRQKGQCQEGARQESRRQESRQQEDRRQKSLRPKSVRQAPENPRRAQGR